MPTLTRVRRHIAALIEADPANAEAIRAMLPPVPAPKTPRKAASKTDASQGAEPAAKA